MKQKAQDENNKKAQWEKHSEPAIQVNYSELRIRSSEDPINAVFKGLALQIRSKTVLTFYHISLLT
jgi:hypothetical protein